MTPRDKLQRAYELAFHPPALHKLWNRMKKGEGGEPAALGEMLDLALLLHQALPEEGVSSPRALNRLALYQAKSRAFGMVRFLRNLRKKMGRPPLAAGVVPGHLVRDIGLPPLARSR